MRRSPLRRLPPPTWLVLALAFAGGWTTLGAQVPRVLSERREPACYDSIPPSAFSRVAVFASVEADSTLPDAASRSLLFSADALLQSLVERVRVLLGATGDRLPHGEPVLGDSTHVWRSVGSDLLVTAHRDGRLVARVDSVRPDSSAAVLFRRALADAVAAGEFFVWPADSVAAALDSLPLRVTLLSVSVDSAGGTHTPKYRRPAVPVFSMLAPWEEPVRPRKVARPVYPDFAQQNGYRGSATIQFVVGEDGRPDMTTLRDLNSARASQLTGERREAYRAFVRVARDAIGRSRYTPARIGGCPVRQLVQQPFGFEFR